MVNHCNRVVSFDGGSKGVWGAPPSRKQRLLPGRLWGRVSTFCRKAGPLKLKTGEGQSWPGRGGRQGWGPFQTREPTVRQQPRGVKSH